MATIESAPETPQSAALGWLLEMELVTNPYVLNSMIMNIFKSISGLKDVQFVIDPREKKLLIYLELKWLHEKFFKAQVLSKVTEMLDDVLPMFKKRIVFDKNILNKAMALANR